MARYRDANCKLCRREGEKLFLKGHRCVTDKCAFERRSYAPGQHGQRMRYKVSDYGKQLREKQKVRRVYGILENQFRNYFVKAAGKTGVTGENLLQMLECRMDNIVYRLGFAPSRKAARQLVRHRSKNLDIIHSSIKEFAQTDELAWLRLNKAALEGELLEVPSRENIPVAANEQLIVELYSK